MRTILPKNTQIDPMFDEKSNVELIEDIHNEVYSAHDLLLKEAENILNKPIDESKIKDYQNLIKLGFDNEKNIKEHKEEVQKIEQSKKTKQTIDYYSFKYPFNKFINEESVIRICNKYGLLLTDVNRFIGGIPEINQKEIINFKIDKKDLPYSYSKESEYTSGTGLFIIATRDQLNMKSARVQGHKLVDIVKEDPIVLQPVKEGYLIVSAWGIEASDKEVQNPRFN
jgi:hypothetical protein